MKKLFPILLSLMATFSFSAYAGSQITKEDAVAMAAKFISSSRPTLKLTKDPAVPYFVPAGPSSGGGPKWVIGFTAIDTKTKEKDIYYVTVFPNGKTQGQVIMGPRMGAVSKSRES
jgi:hypothetical protein